VKKILNYIPSLLILVPLVQTYFNSIYIIEDYEKRIFYLFSLIFLTLFLCFFFVLKNIFKDLKQSTLLTISSWTGFVFLQYRNWTKSFYYIIDGFFTTIDNYIFITWALILIFGNILLLFFSEKEFIKVFLSIWVILSLVSPLYGYFSDFLQTENNTLDITSDLDTIYVDNNENIYFILYDGLARLDTLDEFYGLNPPGLNKELLKRNFFISEDSKSSYGTTQLSLATIFEGEYILEDGSSYKVGNKHILEDYSLINSTAIKQLRNQGYQIFTYSNYFNCDNNLYPDDICLYRKTTNEIAYDLLISTPFQVIVNNQESISFYNDLLDLLKINCQPDCGDPKLYDLKKSLDNRFNELSINKPKFYFFHMKNTHGPFYVDQNCNNLETISYTGIAIEKKSDYINSIKCVEKDLEKFLEEINENATVIIQSDHGPHFNYARTFKDLTSEEIQNRYTTYSALRINSECRNDLQSDFGQVNTFRVIFSCFSKEKLPIKEIKSFYVPINPNYDNIYEITDKFK